MKKHESTTNPMRNAGFGAILKVKTLKKLLVMRTVKCLTNPHYA